METTAPAKATYDEILAFVKNKKGRSIGADTIAAAFGISDSAARQHLTNMVKQGHAVRVARGRYEPVRGPLRRPKQRPATTPPGRAIVTPAPAANSPAVRVLGELDDGRLVIDHGDNLFVAQKLDLN